MIPFCCRPRPQTKMRIHISLNPVFVSQVSDEKVFKVSKSDCEGSAGGPQSSWSAEWSHDSSHETWNMKNNKRGRKEASAGRGESDSRDGGCVCFVTRSRPLTPEQRWQEGGDGSTSW